MNMQQNPSQNMSPYMSGNAGDYDMNMPQMRQPMPAPAPIQPAVPSRPPETVENTYYTAGFLRTQIGKLVRVEFLIGNNMNDRVGRLRTVGASYILIETYDRTSTVMCDIYSIKFVTILNEQQIKNRDIAALYDNDGV